MNKFPDWAIDWMSKGKGREQVSHGLNLALKLENPDSLPLLLWDIVVAGPQIERAMQELSFIHYARFVPSWDGTALMVTTEFDGPLEPYVMDFVIALGDVFDTLLSYVDSSVRPRLPTREHPAEFWSFVQEWNRVPLTRNPITREVLRFPAAFDYPVYSAYPTRTVTDIDGPRKALLPPVIDHPADPVDLDDIQGNILSGYGADSAVHLFFCINDPVAARKWLAGDFPLQSNAWNGVMSAARWVTVPKYLANVAFTYSGLKKLLPDRTADLLRFPDAFRQGAEKRAEINGDTGLSAPGNWRFGRDSQDIHVVLSLYYKQPLVTATRSATAQKKAKAKAFAAFIEIAGTLSQAGVANGMTLVQLQQANALPDHKVYFGYVDGISKPRVSGQCKPDEPDFQPAASPGEFLLGKNYKSIFGGSSLDDLPEDLASNGTFGAIRLIEQHVDLFEQTIQTEAVRLNMTQDELRAKLLGRWKDGEPLALDPTVASGTTPPRNDFDYAPSWEHPKVPNDHDGARCPVGAHIRRTNPRTARISGQRHSRRLIRRGMPTRWDDTVNGNIVTKSGLFGLFIGASLERQFEFIQQQWIQGDLAATGIRDTQDPIAGLRAADTYLRLVGTDDSVSNRVKVPPLVATRGSLYLFFPSISVLRRLDQAAAPLDFRALNAELARHDNSRTSPGFLPDHLLRALDKLRGRLPDTLLGLLEDLLLMKPESTWMKMFIDEFVPESGKPFAPARLSQGDIRPLDPAFIANPFPAYETLRQAGQRIVWVKEHQAYWVLTRTECDRLFDEAKPPNMNFLQQPSGKKLRGLLTMDEPRHAVLRGVVGNAFGVATRKLSTYIAEAVDEAFDRLQHLEQFDYVAEFGAEVPKTVYWRIFGLPRGDIADIDALAQTTMRHFSQPDRPGMNDAIVSADASVRLAGRVALLLAEAMLYSIVPLGTSPYDKTLIGEIAKRTQLPLLPGRPLEFSESLLTLVQLALVHMSAQFLLGSATRNLLLPDPRDGNLPWRQLVTLLPNKAAFDASLSLALEEARRVDPPVTIIQRYTAGQLSIGGITVKKDAPVFALVASANRDGAGGDLEEFHWDRPAGAQHLSLGHGIHECIGKALQETLVHTAIARMIKQMPTLRLCDKTAVPAWIDNIYFRALQSLPVTRCP